MRHYRGWDIWFWLREMGDLDETADTVQPAALRPRSLTVTGANGGEHLDLAVLDQLGVSLAGRLESADGMRAIFAHDLDPNVADAERRMTRLLDRIDAHIAARHGEWPHDPERAAPVKLAPGPASLDLGASGITSVIWASGYRRLYPWLHVDVLDGAGEIVHDRGITDVDGLYVLGLNFQYRRSSHFIGGVGRDAAFLAAHIGGRARPDARWRVAVATSA
jgi:putative flavoprotein involved in K+ transport